MISFMLYSSVLSSPSYMGLFRHDTYDVRRYPQISLTAREYKPTEIKPFVYQHIHK